MLHEKCDMTPLFEADLMQILNELRRRFDTFILGYDMRDKKGNHLHDYWFGGNAVSAIGLTRALEMQIIGFLASHRQPMKEREVDDA